MNPSSWIKYSIYVLLVLFLLLPLIFLYEKECSVDPLILLAKNQETQLIPELSLSLLKNRQSKADLILAKLKAELIFYGKIENPFGYSRLSLGLKTKQEPLVIEPNEPFFLDYNVLAKAYLEQNELQIALFKDDKSLHFSLKKESLPPSLSQVKIASTILDTSYLVKAHFRYCGQDLFLKNHAAPCEPNYRIDLDQQSLFISPKDVLIFKNNAWIICKDKEESLKYYTLQIKEMDEKCLNATLYSPTLPLSINCQLNRFPEFSTPFKARDSFKYLGSRNTREWLFEINGKRSSIKEGQWWLYLDNEWKELTTAEEIDLYVERKIIGELLIIDKQEKVEGEKTLLAKGYNPGRTQEIELYFSLKQNPDEYPTLRPAP